MTLGKPTKLTGGTKPNLNQSQEKWDRASLIPS